MQNSEPLVVLGLAILVMTAAAILVPLVRRTSDVFTAWNFVLLGGALFMGVGSLAVRFGGFHWKELQWFQPRKEDVRIYIIGAIAFYVALFLSYYFVPLPRKLGARVFNKWPPIQGKFVFPCLAFCIVSALATTVVVPIPILSSILRNVSHKGLIFAVVLSFCYWYRNKGQFPLLLLFLAVFLFAVIDSMVVFRGRRLLLSVVSSPIICLYWLNWRYKPVRTNLIRLTVATLIAVTVGGMYSTFRHFDTRGARQERTFSSTIEAMRGATLEGALRTIAEDGYQYFSQYCAHYSLLTIQLVEAGQVKIEPLNSLFFVATYPIPRLLWPGKPDSLGARIIRETLQMPYGTNWGLGIVGNGYHQGGYAVIMLYAFLVVALVRILDDPLTRQPDNIFLLAVLCTSAPHFITWIRGDSGTMTAEIGEAFVFAWGLGLVGRLLFGTAPTTNVGPLSRMFGHRSGQVGTARP